MVGRTDRQYKEKIYTILKYHYLLYNYVSLQPLKLAQKHGLQNHSGPLLLELQLATLIRIAVGHFY